MLAHVARSPVTALAATVIALSLAIVAAPARTPAVVVVVPAAAPRPAAVPVAVPTVYGHHGLRAPIHVPIGSVDLSQWGCMLHLNGFWC